MQIKVQKHYQSAKIQNNQTESNFALCTLFALCFALCFLRVSASYSQSAKVQTFFDSAYFLTYFIPIFMINRDTVKIKQTIYMIAYFCFHILLISLSIGQCLTEHRNVEISFIVSVWIGSIIGFALEQRMKHKF